MNRHHPFVSSLTVCLLYHLCLSMAFGANHLCTCRLRQVTPAFRRLRLAGTLHHQPWGRGTSPPSSPPPSCFVISSLKKFRVLHSKLYDFGITSLSALYNVIPNYMILFYIPNYMILFSLSICALISVVPRGLRKTLHGLGPAPHAAPAELLGFGVKEPVKKSKNLTRRTCQLTIILPKI